MSLEIKTVQLGDLANIWSVRCFHPLCSFGAQRILKADQALTLALTWLAGRAGEERGGGGERHTRRASVEPGYWRQDDGSSFSCTFFVSNHMRL